MKSRIGYALVVILFVALLFGGQTVPAQAAPAAGKTVTSLSQAEIDGLLFIREEEKLAHDVYVVLYATWHQTVFSNITSAETTHMAAVKTLLDRYGLQDPAAGNGLGVFKNPDLQALYNNLVARGKVSLSEALKVGGTIEERDILDIKARLAVTNHTDFARVYNNLIAGSCNHLRAFVSTLKTKTGETYVPQYLSKEVYQTIINGTY